MKKLLTISTLSLVLLGATPVLADGNYGRYDRDGYRHEFRKSNGPGHFDARYEKRDYYDKKHRKPAQYWHHGHSPHASHHGYAHGYRHEAPRHIVRYARDHHGHYYRHHRGHYVIHKVDGRDYYKWVGGAILLGAILHHSDH